MADKTITKKHRLFAMFMAFLMVLGLGNFSKPMTSHADTVNVVETTMSTHKWKMQGGVYQGTAMVNWDVPSWFVCSDGLKSLCINPYVTFQNGAKTRSNIVPVIGQERTTFIANGLDYIRGQYGEGEAGAAHAQMWVWHNLSGVSPEGISWTADVRRTSNWIWGDIDTMLNGATAYANAHAKNRKGNGYMYQGAGQSTAAFWTEAAVGHAHLTKSTAETFGTDLIKCCPNGYSLEGAVYGVYTDSGLTNKVGEFTTGADGSANTLELTPGQYFVKELTPAKGYRLDPEAYTVTVTAGQTSEVAVSDEVIFDPVYLKLTKQAEEGADKNLSVAGAVYTLKYYAPEADGSYPTEPTKSWDFKSNDKGIVSATTKNYVEGSGDSAFFNKRGTLNVPIGKLTIEEKTAPKGFARTEGVIVEKIFDGVGHTATQADVELTATDTEKEQKIKIHVQKIDSETGKPVPQGVGSFEGAVFGVAKYDKLTGEDTEVYEITTDKDGKAETGELKPGLYKVYEKKAPKGYILNTEKQDIRARITEINKAVFDYTVEVKEDATTTEIYKIDKSTKENLAGSTIQVLDKDNKVIDEFVSTDKKHVLKGLTVGETYKLKEIAAPKGYVVNNKEVEFTVKDTKEPQKVEMENDFTKTEISKKDMSSGEAVKGAKLQLLDENGAVVDKWISDGKAHLTEKLEVGKKYRIHEVEAPKGYFIQEKDVEFTVENTTKVQAQQIENMPVPEVHTTATFENGLKDHQPKGMVKVIDNVHYKKLVPGLKYEMLAKLVDKANPETVVAEKTVEFTPEKADGTYKVEFEVDASKLAGKRTVAFETVRYEGKDLVIHADINDEDQTVSFPEIKTTATNMKGGKVVYGGKDSQFKDVVEYKGLTPGKEKRFEGKIIDKETKKPVLDKDGKEITAYALHTPKESNGKAEVVFHFDGSVVAGKDIVVFEKVLDGKVEVAVHEDPTDKGQTVSVPKIGTQMTSNGKKVVNASKNTPFEDKIKHENVPAGEYTVKGKIVYGNIFGVEVVKEVEKKVTVTEKNGTVTVDFNLDTTNLKGKQLVAFEEWYDANGVLVAEHKDIHDKGQTVEIKKDIPNTGDVSNIMGYGSLLVVAGALVLVIKRRKSNEL